MTNITEIEKKYKKGQLVYGMSFINPVNSAFVEIPNGIYKPTPFIKPVFEKFVVMDEEILVHHDKTDVCYNLRSLEKYESKDSQFRITYTKVHPDNLIEDETSEYCIEDMSLSSVSLLDLRKCKKPKYQNEVAQQLFAMQMAAYNFDTFYGDPVGALSYFENIKRVVQIFEEEYPGILTVKETKNLTSESSGNSYTISDYAILEKLINIS